MKETPMICPNCGELLIVSPFREGRTLMIPWHEDMIEPGAICAMSYRIFQDGELLPLD